MRVDRLLCDREPESESTLLGSSRTKAADACSSFPGSSPPQSLRFRSVRPCRPGQGAPHSSPRSTAKSSQVRCNVGGYSVRHMVCIQRSHRHGAARTRLSTGSKRALVPCRCERDDEGARFTVSLRIPLRRCSRATAHQPECREFWGARGADLLESAGGPFDRSWCRTNGRRCVPRSRNPRIPVVRILSRGR